VVGIPDSLKGQMPFAFVTTNTSDTSTSEEDEKLLAEINALVRRQVGAIATLGGMIRGKGMIPKTRSGKTLRRVLRELLENAVQGEGEERFNKAVNVPSTVEDASVVEVAREMVRRYFVDGKGRERHGSVDAGGVKAKL